MPDYSTPHEPNIPVPCHFCAEVNGVGKSQIQHHSCHEHRNHTLYCNDCRFELKLSPRSALNNTCERHMPSVPNIAITTECELCSEVKPTELTPFRSVLLNICDDCVSKMVESDGLKFDDGKIDFTYTPVAALEAMAKVFMHGEKKYARHNYRKLENGAFRFHKALMRHLMSWQAGEELDKDSGLPHLHHALTCLAVLVYYGSVEDIGDWR